MTATINSGRASVLVPIAITDAMYVGGTAVEPGPGEVAWTNIAWAKDAICCVIATHKRYQAAVAVAAGGVSPDLDIANATTSTPAKWVELGPTNKWAAFDGAVSTQSAIAGTLTFVLKPGFFNGLALVGLEGSHIHVVVKDRTGGNVIYEYDKPLESSRPGDWYEYFFSPFKPQTDLYITDIEPYYSAELTVTITSPTVAKCGVLAVGDVRKLGGAQYGAKAKLIDYSYLKIDAFGNNVFKKRANAKSMSATIWIDIADADGVTDTMAEVLTVPCMWILTGLPNYRALRVWGMGSGEVSFDLPTYATLSLDVQGLI